MKKGFTLMELLLALGMSALIFVVVSSLMVTILSSNTKSKRNEVFEQIKNDLVVEFINRVRWAQVVSAEDNASSDVITADADRYMLNNGILLRNNEPITPENIEVTRFDVVNKSNIENKAGLEITVSFRDRNFVLLEDVLNIQVAQRVRSSTGVSL